MCMQIYLSGQPAPGLFARVQAGQQQRQQQPGIVVHGPALEAALPALVLSPTLQRLTAEQPAALQAGPVHAPSVRALAAQQLPDAITSWLASGGLLRLHGAALQVCTACRAPA